MADETPEQRRARFEQAMRAAGATFSDDPKPAATPQTSPDQPAPAGEAPAPEPSQSSGADPSAAAVTPAADAQTGTPSPWWKLKVRALEEDHELDLEKMAREQPEELTKLVGRGLAHERIRDDLKRKRDEAVLALEEAKGSAATERDRRWIASLQRQGFTVQQDPQAPDGVRIVPLKPQSAAVAGAAQGQTDLDALEKRATEENTPEAWRDYTRALRNRAERALDEDGVRRLVESKLSEAQRKLEESQAQQRQVADFGAKVEATIKSLDAKFAKAGDLKDHYITVARERALAHSQAPGATEASVLKVFHDTADLVERSMANAQQQLAASAKPRPKAPTVIPSGGAPAPAAEDPASFDLKTPEGKKKAADYLAKLASQRRAPVPAAV